MYLLALPLIVGAPLPPPRPLSAELIVGRWNCYEWGTMGRGWIVFEPDGMYFSRHSEGVEPVYAGHWSIRGNVLTLHEGRLCSDSPLVITTDYPVVIDTRDLPDLAGSYHGTPVKLRR